MRPGRPSRQATQGDTTGVTPDASEQRRGAGLFHRPPAHHERATVFDVDARRHSYDVVTNQGRRLSGIGRMRTSPGDRSLIPLHTPVRINWSLGTPYIDGILPYETSEVPSDQAGSVTDMPDHGGQDPVLDRNMLANFRGAGEPNDILPGDSVHQSPDGATLAALHGKLAIARGSQLAQLRLFGETDSVELISGQYRHVTWMGESKVTNDDGRTSFTWRGGSNQLTQTGADEERYTLRLDAGASGDLFNFEVTTPQGQPLFRFHVDPHGRLTLLTAGGFEHLSGSSPSHEHPRNVQGNEVVDIAGTHALHVRGRQLVRVDQDHSFESAGNSAIVVGNDQNTVVMRNLHLQVNGLRLENVRGNDTTVVLQGHKRLAVEQGDWDTNITRDVLLTVGRARRVTITGTDELTVTQGSRQTNVRQGSYNVIVDTGDAKIYASRVELGSISGSTPDTNAVRFRELQLELQRLTADLNVMKGLLLSHVHPTAAAGPPSVSPSLAVLTSFGLNLEPARSRTVFIL
jgi:hypothetical protein